MTWYYVESGQQRGPVSETELQGLVQSGVVREETLVWREGMANWQAYREAAAPQGASLGVPATAATTVTCSECKGVFPAEQTIQYGGAYVCTGCKPIFLQRLREGGEPRGKGTQLTTEELLQRDYTLSAGSCVSRAWNLVTTSPVTIGAAWLGYLLLMAASLIPFVGALVQIAVQGPIFGGIYGFYLKRMRGDSAAIGEMFTIMGDHFLQLLLVSLVITGLAFVCFFPGGVVLGLGMATGGLDWSAWLAFAIALFAVGTLVVIYLSVCWIFAFLLVVDRAMNFWPAMELSRKMVVKHWFQVFWVLAVGALLMMAGLLACLVGVIITLPLFLGMVAYAYEDMFS